MCLRETLDDGPFATASDLRDFISAATCSLGEDLEKVKKRWLDLGMGTAEHDDFFTFTVGDDVLDIADHEHAVGSRTHVPARWLLDLRTQYMPLSAAIKQRLV